MAAPALLITIIFAFQTAAHADNAAVSILYYESVRLATAPETSSQNGPALLRFDAYGRRFELLIDETRIVRGSNLTRLSGRLNGLPGSWFRLLRDEDTLSGMIDDGTDTWLVEPWQRVSDLLIDTPTGDAPVNVIFRLADTLVPQGLLSCATTNDAVTDQATIDGQSAYKNLGAELQGSNASASANAAAGKLRVGVVADESFVAQNLTESKNEILSIFNTVQGIYQNKIGVEIKIADIFLVTPGLNPFSSTLVAKDLLKELGQWRSINQRNLGHTHLLTSKRLLGEKSASDLSGISYVGQPGRSGVCDPTTGTSVSRNVRGLTALIVAHELGHNLGAPHDGAAGEACASAPNSGFIMSARISPQTKMEFSSCSATQMDRVIAAASCMNATAQSLPANTGGGGGGGALNWLTLAGLIACLFLRCRRTQSSSV